MAPAIAISGKVIFKLKIPSKEEVKEACQLVESGFDYVTEVDGIKIFKKPR